MDRERLKNLLNLLGRWAPALAFGVAFLYWEGYLFLITYLRLFSISLNLSDFSFQDILLFGINPLLTTLLWIAKKLLVFELIKNLLPISPTGGITLDWLVVSLTILFVYIFYRFGIHRLIILVSNSPFQKYVRLSKLIIIYFLLTFILFFLPRWSAPQAQELGYQIFSRPYQIALFYQEPALTSNDKCDTNKKCMGSYTKILDGKDYLYVTGNGCLLKKIKYNFDIGPNGEKIGMTPTIETSSVCHSIAVPKQRILEVINL